MQRIPSKEKIASHILELHIGQVYDRDKLIKFLVDNGYTRSSFVTTADEFAIRGEMIDIGSNEFGNGHRINFSGDKIELIKKFDIASQLTINTKNSVCLMPANELVSSDQNTETIFDYLDQKLIILDTFTIQEMEKFLNMAAQIYSNKKAINVLSPDSLWLQMSDIKNILQTTFFIELSPYEQASHIGCWIKSVPNFYTDKTFLMLESFIRAQWQEKRDVIISCFSLGSADRIMQMLKDRDIPAAKTSYPRDNPNVQLIIARIRHSAILDDRCIISEEDIFGEKSSPITQKQRELISNFALIDEQFKLNALLVHKDHGIGRFEGLEVVTLSNSQHDCLKLCYADNERLLLPVENMDLLSRHSCFDATTKLDKLGGSAWQIRKARAKSKITEMAAQLMETAAQRSLKCTNAILTNSAYEQFCANFPYIETEDQSCAIASVLEDLAEGRPMERLICGDTGFGKTEIAIRAAFITAQQSRQLVAMICPTTLLCRQHYHVFKERFAGTGIKIAHLSRLTPHRDETIEAINSGQINIIIGTHALLNEKICYDNLALLIIDEEHRFGVTQKEKLKALKKDTHVIALSATPIPRTLQMALGGIKKFSLITTPPLGRTATKVSLISFERNLIREALMKEKGRGGQVFYICPRISDLDELEQQLIAIAPELTMRKLHGQMPIKKLDHAIAEFYEGKFDLLLSTSIVESGLDIPRANTIIVHRADLFGLAQLYQLKGRVGRSNVDSYAYFTLMPNVSLSETALKRLQVLKNLDEFGSGFSIASHDMELRGFGNLVGEKQSGHIKEIGMELYQQMFEEALAELKAPGEIQHEKKQEYSPRINIDASVLIPESYIQDFDLRLELYSRISRLNNEAEIVAMGAELVDRFGPLPKEVEHLLAIVALKHLCIQASVEKINLGKNGISIKFIGTKLGRQVYNLLNFAMKAPNLEITIQSF